MYTIRLNTPTQSPREATKVIDLLERLRDRFSFTASFDSRYAGVGLKKNAPLPRFLILLRRIRLEEPKPYCGQHPGSCEFPNRKKPTSRLLEWDDWVEFNNRVNAVLDSKNIDADVWSLPHDVKGKFWIRKDNRARSVRLGGDAQRLRPRCSYLEHGHPRSVRTRTV